MKSLIWGDRLSVRLPNRIVPIWVKEPIGLANPFFIASTPAMNVEVIAPIPGITTPNFPFAGAIVFPLEIIFQFLKKDDANESEFSIRFRVSSGLY
jgi:hypothetical protein